MRGQARYDIQPETRFRNIDLTADWNIDRGFGVRSGITHSPRNSLTSVTGGVNWDQGTFAIGLNADVRSDHTFSGLLTLRVGFGINPRNNKLYTRSRGMSRSGAVAPRAFLDMEGTGRFDPGDVPLQDVEFSGRGLIGGDTTDENGVAFLPGIGPYRQQLIELDIVSLEDPFLAPTDPRQGFFVRPGQTTYLDFPVVPTGEIDGNVMIVSDGRERPARGARLELVREDGTIAQNQLVTFDGYYYFGAVPYGSYTLRLARDHDTFIPITLNAENDFAWDTNFTVERE